MARQLFDGELRWQDLPEYKTPELRSTRARTNAWVALALVQSIWCFALWASLSTLDGPQTRLADMTAWPALQWSGLLVVVGLVGTGAAWSLARIENVHRLGDGQPTRARAGEYAVIASLAIVQPVVWGLLWLWLVAESDAVIQPGTLSGLRGLTLAAAIGPVFSSLLMVFMSRAQLHRIESLQVRNEHRFLRSIGLNPYEPSVSDALVQARLAREAHHRQATAPTPAHPEIPVVRPDQGVGDHDRAEPPAPRQLRLDGVTPTVTDGPTTSLTPLEHALRAARDVPEPDLQAPIADRDTPSNDEPGSVVDASKQAGDDLEHEFTGEPATADVSPTDVQGSENTEGDAGVDGPTDAPDAGLQTNDDDATVIDDRKLTEAAPRAAVELTSSNRGPTEATDESEAGDPAVISDAGIDEVDEAEKRHTEVAAARATVERPLGRWFLGLAVARVTMLAALIAVALTSGWVAVRAIVLQEPIRNGPLSPTDVDRLDQAMELATWAVAIALPAQALWIWLCAAVSQRTAVANARERPASAALVVATCFGAAALLLEPTRWLDGLTILGAAAVAAYAVRTIDPAIVWLERSRTIGWIWTGCIGTMALVTIMWGAQRLTTPTASVGWLAFLGLLQTQVAAMTAVLIGGVAREFEDDVLELGDDAETPELVAD